MKSKLTCKELLYWIPDLSGGVSTKKTHFLTEIAHRQTPAIHPPPETSIPPPAKKTKSICSYFESVNLQSISPHQEELSAYLSEPCLILMMILCCFGNEIEISFQSSLNWLNATC